MFHDSQEFKVYFYTPKLKFSRGLAKFFVTGDHGNSGYDVFTYAYHLKNDETVESGLSVLNSKAYKFVLNSAQYLGLNF